jgi:uncharacterized membrane protein
MSALECASSKRLRTAIAVMLVALALAVAPLSSAETPSSEWSVTYSGWVGNSVIQTADGGYAIAGSTAAYRAVLIKTDSSGGVQWQQEYGTEVFGGNNAAVSVVQTADSGYLLFGAGGYLVKTDAEGTVQWTKNLQVSGLCAGIKTSDGSYVMVGNQRNIYNENVVWLIKTDTQGSLLWNKTFTGGFNVHDVVETHDRGVALAGNSKNDFWLAKIDSNGNLQWSQTYVCGSASDLFSVFSLARTDDGGFVLAGAGTWNGGIVPWLLKIDSQGHDQWVLPYGQIPTNSFSSIVQTADYGYTLALGNGARLFRTDASGSDQWYLTYADASGTNVGEAPPVTGVTYRLPSVIRTNDGGYVVLDTIFANTIRLTKISPEPDILPPVLSILSPTNAEYETNEVSLTFKVNEPTSWLGYSLDGQDTVTITGNTTLSGLASGDHTLTVYATDTSGNDSSKTISFTIATLFPVEWIIAIIVVVAAVCGCLLFYFKKKSLSTYKQQGFLRCLKQRLTSIVNTRLARNLILISLCIIMVLVQFFVPYFYFASLPSNSNSFEVGITYVYEQDNIGQIYDQVSHIKNLGFQVIRVNLVCNSEDPGDYANSLTDVFFDATQNLGMRVTLIIHNDDAISTIDYYLGRWGDYLYCIQVLNEPELSSSWDIGALFTDDEITSKFEQAYSVIESHHLSVLLYTNFEAGFVVRSNLPIQFSEKLNFVGFDVFMDSFLVLTPNFVQLLHEITNKDVIITEFGMSSTDDLAQSDFIIRGLNLFKNMGLKGCWIVYWNSLNNAYGIRGRLAEQTVSEWIAQNT